MLFGGVLILGALGIISLRRQTIKWSIITGYHQITQMSIRHETTESGENNTIATWAFSGMWGAALTGITPINHTSSTGEEVSTPTTPENNDNAAVVSNTPLTYRQLIPYIVNKYQLSATDKPYINFSQLSSTEEEYSAFKAAYYGRFIGRTINPDKFATCDNYAVFVWLAQRWPVSYTASNVNSVFWTEAEKRWLLHGCVKGASVVRGNLD